MESTHMIVLNEQKLQKYFILKILNSKILTISTAYEFKGKKLLLWKM